MTLEYPAPEKGTDGDDYHGEWVADPYRSLEDTDASGTVAWIKAENELTERWLDGVGARGEIIERLEQLWDFPRFDAPFEAGGRWFEFRNSGLEPQSVLFMMDEPGEKGRVLLDPNTLSEDGTVAVTSAVPSKDGSLVAYGMNGAGSDWTTWRVRNTATGEDLDDVVEWSKFSTAAFLRDGSGFFYGAPEPPPEGEEYAAENRVPRVILHRIGTDQALDEVVYSAPHEPDWLPHASVSDDGSFLLLTITRGTRHETRLEVRELRQDGRGDPVVLNDFEAEAEVVGNVGERFFLVTNDEAERRRLVAVELDAPARENWVELVPEMESTLLAAFHCGGSLVCWYLEDACARLRVHDLDGTFRHEIELPPFSSVVSNEHGSVTGRPGLGVVHFGLTSFTDSGSVWSYDLASGETRVLHQSASAFEADAYVTERTYATSTDGTRVPVFLTRRRDLQPTGEVPVLQYGYGGFNIPLGPQFSPEAALFMERGGIYVVANLRGGGEFGTQWYDAGRLAHKQNVFDDFVATARHLVELGWTRPGRIAINGRSNGGLLVGACLTQHPEAFGAAIPEVGVLDMLRFHKFTIGWAWTSDFGDPDDEGQYRWIRDYSPLHNIRQGADYPATLITTGDHDDRVVPGHSFKFAASLQAAQGGEAPILVRIDASAGHGMGKPTAKRIRERADVLTFIEGAIASS